MENGARLQTVVGLPAGYCQARQQHRHENQVSSHINLAGSGFTKTLPDVTLETQRSDRIGRMWALHVGDRECGSWLRQSNDLYNLGLSLGVQDE